MKTGAPLPERVLEGLGVSRGTAIGTVCIIDAYGVSVSERQIADKDVEAEVARLTKAVDETRREFVALARKSFELGARDNAEQGDSVGVLFEAFEGMLAPDSRLVKGAIATIRRERVNAEAAAHGQIQKICEQLRKANDSYIAARAEDVEQTGAALIRHFTPPTESLLDMAPPGSVVLAETLTPADAARMKPPHVLGCAAMTGGMDGHAAIVARARDIPAVFGVPDLMSDVKTGDPVIIDGDRGLVVLHPSPATLQRYGHVQLARQEKQRELRQLATVPSVTADGVPIRLHANIEQPDDVEAALAVGADGIGLLRTEFMFMNRSDLPGEEEQRGQLEKIVKAMNGRPVTIRTLDVGGEKLAAPLFDKTRAANPALGLRAIRLGLKMPELLKTQLAAILKASRHGPVRILIPMVSSASQMVEVRKHLVSVARARGINGRLPPVGAMIEIPSAALAADTLTKICDFFAIGSNDLTQYTLAIDRGDEHVAELYDPFHPAVLRLIEFTAAAAWRAGKPVSLCGELAGDPRATALLVGLGLTELSMSPPRLLEVKRRICALSRSASAVLAQRVMEQTDRDAIVELLAEGSNSGVTPAKEGSGGLQP